MHASHIRTHSDFAHYLAVKKSIDDRALNARIWQSFAGLVSELDQPLIFEPGCGIGTMLERLIENEVIASAEYVGMDLNADNIDLARGRIAEWAVQRGYSVRATGPAVLIEGSGVAVEAKFLHGDALNERDTGSATDVLLAHAFLDLVDIPAALDRLMPGLRPDGIFYFTLVFDGLTIIEPEDDPELDAEIMRLYHESMDKRIVSGQPSGDRRSGRHLFRHLQEIGAELLESGSSDWVVFPRKRAYSDAEFEFLEHILLTIEQALSGSAQLDPQTLARWISQRSEQLRQGKLTYIAHQMDFLGRARTPRIARSG
ncbi:MAG: class I SAM-dependent methyltransferase [Anaerolineales bacterium]